MCVSFIIARAILTHSRLAACQRGMLTHRKDPFLFTKAPLIPYLSSVEQEFPLLISVQNLPHAWDTDLAEVPISIVVQIQKQSPKSFLNLHAFLRVIINKGELNDGGKVICGESGNTIWTGHTLDSHQNPGLQAGQHCSLPCLFNRTKQLGSVTKKKKKGDLFLQSKLSMPHLKLLTASHLKYINVEGK